MFVMSISLIWYYRYMYVMIMGEGSQYKYGGFK